MSPGSPGREREAEGGFFTPGAAGAGLRHRLLKFAGGPEYSPCECRRRRRRVSFFWVPLAGLGPPIQPRRQRRRQRQRQQVNSRPRAPARPTWSSLGGPYGSPERTSAEAVLGHERSPRHARAWNLEKQPFSALVIRSCGLCLRAEGRANLIAALKLT